MMESMLAPPPAPVPLSAAPVPSDAGGAPRVRRALLILAVVGALAFGASAVWRACYLTLERSDFPVFLAAGRAVLEGTDLYAARSARGWHYAYPPPFAILMVPLTLVPKPLASFVWYLVSLACFAHALQMCVSAVSPGWRDRFFLYALPALVLAWPLASSLERGQTSLLMLWLTVVAVSRSRTAPLSAALGLAGAILLRGFPGILLAYFAWRRRWRFVGAAALITLLLGLGPPALVLGWERNLSYLERWATEVVSPALTLSGAPAQTPMHDGRYDPNLVNNQSLSAVLQRLSGSRRAPFAGVGIGALMALMTATVARRPRRATEPLLIAQAFVWMLLIIPVARAYYFVLLLWPVTVLLILAAESSPSRARWSARMALAVLAGLGLLGALWETARFYGPLCWGTMATWLALLIALADADHDPALGSHGPAPVVPLNRGAR